MGCFSTLECGSLLPVPAPCESRDGRVIQGAGASSIAQSGGKPPHSKFVRATIPTSVQCKRKPR